MAQPSDLDFETPVDDIPEDEGEQGSEATVVEQQSALAKLMTDRGITEEKAAEILSKQTDTEAQEQEALQQQQTERAFGERFEQTYDAIAGQRFAQHLRDANFASKALAHIRANHPGLAPDVAQEEDPDPVAAVGKKTAAELAQVRRELEEAKAAINETRQTWAAQQHQSAVVSQIDRYFARHPEHQRFEQALGEEIAEAYDMTRGGAFRNPAMSVPQFIQKKLQRITSFAGADAPVKPKSMPPRNASGRPTVAPQRQKLPDLSPHGIARGAMDYMREHGDFGVEE